MAYDQELADAYKRIRQLEAEINIWRSTTRCRCWKCPHLLKAIESVEKLIGYKISSWRLK
jgi:aerobic-type carbon monoxide dehydrogenase small subunit (CoxS/CutS family)